MLHTILGSRGLADGVFKTVFCVEHELNSLLLTPVSADPFDFGSVTNNQILSRDKTTEFDYGKRYAHAQSYANADSLSWLT